MDFTGHRVLNESSCGVYKVRSKLYGLMPTSARKHVEAIGFRVDVGIDPY